MSRILSVICVLSVIGCTFTLGQLYHEPCFQVDEPCDTIANLYCSSSGICECQFPWMVYNPTRRVCQVSAGHECDSGSNLMCTEHGTCVTEGDKKECVCDEDFEPCDLVSEDLSEGEDVLQRKICCQKNSDEES